MIPKEIEGPIEALVRERDEWKRKALAYAPEGTPEHADRIKAIDRAAERILYAIGVEGMLSRAAGGARGAMWEALISLRPDIAETIGCLEDDAFGALQRFFRDSDGDPT